MLFLFSTLCGSLALTFLPTVRDTEVTLFYSAGLVCSGFLL